ncbi:MAG: RT0821/Lpp0805 family surface protein, partial [Thioalkalivibrionaceae bacterium]
GAPGWPGAISGGPFLGGGLGGAMGRSLDATDRQRLFSTLESQPDNRTTAWRNPNTGQQYQATPVNTFRSGGADCREYQMRAEIDGRWETVTGTACRDAQGRWINQ